MLRRAAEICDSLLPRALAAGLRRSTGGRSVLRVGYVEARPWSYRAQQGVQGLDTMAMSVVAQAMGCATEFHCRPPWLLAEGLLNGEYDVAIGGLLDCRESGLVAVTVPHAQLIDGVDHLRSRCRRVFFPNVWWIRRRDAALRYRIAATLFWWRVRTRMQCMIGGGESGRSSLPE